MPGPVFTSGERISLRTIEEDDLAFVQRWRNHADVRVPLTDTDIRNGEQMEEYLEEQVSEKGSINLLVCIDRETTRSRDNEVREADTDGESESDVDTEPIGEVAIPWIRESHGTGMLMYWIAPAHQGNGYATEAAALVLDHAFNERRVNKVWANVLVSNTGSQRVLEKLGFTQEGHLRQDCFIDGSFEDVHRYGLLADEWQS